MSNLLLSISIKIYTIWLLFPCFKKKGFVFIFMLGSKKVVWLCMCDDGVGLKRNIDVCGHVVKMSSYMFYSTHIKKKKSPKFCADTCPQ
jgi:hypothetical protein